MEKKRRKHIHLINETKVNFQRYLINKLPWNERLVGIKGSRGVGKTTLILQYIKQTYGLSEDALYISLDDLYFTDNSLTDFIEDFVAKGGKHLFIDEVHKYKTWSIELKNIYDTYSNLKIVFTGSSLLEILNSKSDLSRRALVYNLQGLSFREFLNFYYDFNFEAITFEDILRNHLNIALDITSKTKVLKYWSEYYKFGYFPFYKKDEILYYKKLQEIINLIIEIELPLLRKTDISLIRKIKQLLYIMSNSVPFSPNISALANKIKITRKTLLEYLHYLTDANVLKALNKDSFGISLLQKPEKIFFENTNFLFAIKYTEPNIGNIRETIFFNQLSQNNKVNYSDYGDFLVNDKYIFEIGGKNKSKKQIANLKDAYIVSDDIEFGIENKIPLWLFGFLY